MSSRSANSSGVTSTGPSGAKPASDLPRLNCGTLLGRHWMSRSERSWPTVRPATTSHARDSGTFRAGVPMITAISTSQSTVSVDREIASNGPATAVDSLGKTSGTSGTSIPDSAP